MVCGLEVDSILSMIRELGLIFINQDLYAENLYAHYFVIYDLPSDNKFMYPNCFWYWNIYQILLRK
jgi:hypothetical protein